MRIEADPELLRYVVEKGSIARRRRLADRRRDWTTHRFTVSLIPETLERTNLGRGRPGTKVNLEVDVLAKYVERLVGNRGGDA